MLFRKEEEKTIYGTCYKIKQLPGAVGARLLIKFLRVFFSGANGLNEILQNEHIKKIIEDFFTTSLVINDLALEDLPADIKLKLNSVKGTSAATIDEFKTILSDHLSPSEITKHFLTIYNQAAFSSTPEFSSLLSMSGHLISFIQSVLNNINEDDFDSLLSDLINKSVVRYQPEGEQKTLWLSSDGNYAFDEHFGGRYHALLELFVYLILFNYAESLIMLKKNQILDFLRPYLKMLKPAEEAKQ